MSCSAGGHGFTSTPPTTNNTINTIPYVYWTVHHLDSWIKIDKLDVTCFIISLFTAQHVSNVSTSIFRSLRLIVDLFHRNTVTPTHIEPGKYNTWNKSTISRKLLKMDVLTFETCWALNSEIKSKWHQAGLSLFNHQDDARSNKHKINALSVHQNIQSFTRVNFAYTEAQSYSTPSEPVTTGLDGFRFSTFSVSCLRPKAR